MNSPTVMLLGDVTHREFVDASNWLNDQCETTAHNDIPESAIEQIGERQPNWVVVAQSRPGQYQQRAIDKIRGAAPLTTIIALLGSLCEGEMRTGEPWRGAIRVYWHQFVERADQNLRRVEAGEPSWWTPQGETFSNAVTHQELPPNDAALVVIAARDFATYESYAAEFQRAGYATLWRHPYDRLVLSGAHHGVWIGSGTSPDEMTQLSQFAGEVLPAPVTALLNFVRLADVAAAKNAGAETVLAKPIRVAELLSTPNR